jgi:hypothetical protein
MTDRFVVTAREMAALQGLAEYPFVVIDHPIAGNPDAELRGKVEHVVSSIVSLMTVRGSRG